MSGSGRHRVLRDPPQSLYFGSTWADPLSAKAEKCPAGRDAGRCEAPRPRHLDSSSSSRLHSISHWPCFRQQERQGKEGRTVRSEPAQSLFHRSLGKHLLRHFATLSELQLAVVLAFPGPCLRTHPVLSSAQSLHPKPRGNGTWLSTASRKEQSTPFTLRRRGTLCQPWQRQTRHDAVRMRAVSRAGPGGDLPQGSGASTGP